MVFNLDKFQITADTMYQYLTHTKSLPANRVVQFDVSQVTALSFQFDNIPKSYFHNERAPSCQLNGRRWLCKRQRYFDDAEEFLTEITVNGYQRWCAQCYKPLFGMPTCSRASGYKHLFCMLVCSR
jgi:hypothetical protein